jgi:hypothetical protein
VASVNRYLHALLLGPEWRYHTAMLTRGRRCTFDHSAAEQPERTFPYGNPRGVPAEWATPSANEVWRLNALCGGQKLNF